MKPKFVQVDSVFVRKNTGKKRKTDIAPRHFYYVPVLSVLEQLLAHPDHPTLIERKVDDNPEILDFYMKGKFAANNPILKVHPDALKIILYYDDFEACVPLGSYASGKQKLWAFYLTLDNINPKYRASLKSICFVALVNAAYFKEPGSFDFVLERIKKDLDFLENGVMLNGELIFGTQVACTGDNLGMALLGGFTANQFCRFGMEDLNLTHSLTREDPSLVRTIYPIMRDRFKKLTVLQL